MLVKARPAERLGLEALGAGSYEDAVLFVYANNGPRKWNKDGSDVDRCIEEAAALVAVAG